MYPKKFKAKNYSFGNNGLLEAVKKNDIVKVRSLLAAGADVNAADTDSGWTPLNKASNYGRTKIVKLLMDAGANVNYVDDGGYTPLIFAAQSRHTGVVKLLLDAPGINVNAANNFGWTPLHHASDLGMTKVVKLLLAFPGINVNPVGAGRRTPLYVAAMDGHIGVVELLLAAPGINVNTEDIDGRTSLHEAARRGNTKVVELLLDAGADVNTETTRGWTPLHHAAKRGHIEVVKFLLAAWADPVIQNNRGQTALDLAKTDEIMYLLNPMGRLENVRTPVSIKDDVCAICTELLNSDKVVETSCGHQFHLKCLNNAKKASSNCPLCRKRKAFFGKRATKKPKAKKVPKKLTLQAKKFGINLTVKRNGSHVRKTNLMKHIAMRKKVAGRPRKSLPFLKELRKKTSFGKKPKASLAKLKKKARKLGIRVTIKRNGKRVDKPKSLLSKQIAVRKKMIGKKLNSFGPNKAK